MFDRWGFRTDTIGGDTDDSYFWLLSLSEVIITPNNTSAPSADFYGYGYMYNRYGPDHPPVFVGTNEGEDATTDGGTGNATKNPGGTPTRSANIYPLPHPIGPILIVLGQPIKALKPVGALASDRGRR